MKNNLKHFAQMYVDWVIKLGRVRSSLLGLIVLAILALCTQIVLSLCVVGQVHWSDVGRSIVFGLISAPIVLYFFSLLVEKLENSRIALSHSVEQLRQEVQERMDAEMRLSEAVANLEKTSRDKTTLMATISHELRTPLNGIIGLSRIVLDEPLNAQQRNYLQTIYSSAVSLSYIFSDIIDLEKLDAQRIELNRQPTDIYALLNDISNFAHIMAQQKHLKFEINYRNHLPHWLMLDNVRLSQILWNLINNAVKFTEQGKITLHIEQRDVDKFAFHIEDTGIGISAAEIHKIFTLYYQVSENPNKALGSGIGLAISKTIAQLMEGDLTVRSEVGKGSTFTLTFRAAATEQPVQIHNPTPTTLRILLVEDIEVNILVAKSVLEKFGYQVDVAMTGQSAIEKFEQNYYDLVLLDIQLPDMSGFDVAAHLHKNYAVGVYDYLPPLIALTANVMHDKQDYLERGMDDVLRKPLSLEELNRCLNTYFGEDMAYVEIKTPEKNTALWTDCEYLDKKMLGELIEILGVKFVQDNLQLFKQTMPEYLQQLQHAYQDYLQNSKKEKDVRALGHKIKGAVSSVGLKRLQQIAAKIQNGKTEEWNNQVENWLNDLHQHWQTDADILGNWLEEH